MSEQKEFNASTVEEALERAVSVLGIERESLSYQILDEGSSGFLGLGVRDARIAVEAPVDVEKPPAAEETVSPETSATPRDEPAGRVFPTTEELTPDPEPSSESADLPVELLSGIREHVETTLDAMGFEGEVSARDTGEVVLVEIDAEDTGLLIGQKGETLDAMQYLVNISIYRDHQFSKKVILDCGGYRDRRVKAVQGMALRAAKRVIREDKAKDLPPMSSSERRAVHSYLKDNPQVTTSSEGDEDHRRVTISPARA